MIDSSKSVRKGAIKEIDRSRRIALRANARYGHERPPQLSSMTSNLSGTGLHIKANRLVYLPGITLHITLDVGSESFKCEGVVAWSKKVPAGFDRVIHCGMGVRFSKFPDKLMEYYEKRLIDLTG